MNLAALLDRLRAHADEATSVRNLVPPSRRDRFDRVRQDIVRIAEDVERAMKQASAS